MAESLYFLIGRAKAGEIDAIGRLAPSTQQVLRPMLDFPRQGKKDRRPLRSYLAEKVSEIAHSWGTSREVCLDFSLYEPDDKVSDGRHVVDFVFDVARQRRLKSVPVLAPPEIRGPGTDYFAAVSRVAACDMRGVALRLPYEYFSRADELKRAAGEALALAALSPQLVDLYLDAHSLALVPEDAREESALAAVVRCAALTAQGMGYRRIIFAASNMPDSITRHEKGEVLRIPRTEFRVWRRVVADPHFAFLGFADYGIVYPGQVESDAPVIPPSRTRTTSEDEYVLYKGSHDNIRAVSQAAMTDGMLSRQEDSWGVNAIRECAEGYGDPGGPAQWVSRDTNMHIESTVAAIARYTPFSSSTPEQDVLNLGIPWLQQALGLTQKQ